MPAVIAADFAVGVAILSNAETVMPACARIFEQWILSLVEIRIIHSDRHGGNSKIRFNYTAGQIEQDIRMVGDRSLAKPVRAKALKFLIHIAGDVHQPLHAAGNDDRGGNAVRVILNGERTNPHAVRDHDVVEVLGAECALSAPAMRGDEKKERAPWMPLALVGRDIASDMPP